MELRPLGFGEIFDRAVTLYVRNFVPFAAIVGVLILPTVILQYFNDVNSLPQFDAAIRILTHRQAPTPGSIPPAFGSPSAVAALLGLLLLAYAAWPFVLNAIAVGVALAYRNVPVGFRACFEPVLRRWSQIVGLLFIDLLVFFGCYVTFMVIAVVVGIIIVLFSSFAPAVGAFLGVLFIVAGIVAFLGIVALLWLALSFAMYATVIEELPPIESLVLGFHRVFNHQEFWRALLFSVAAAAIVVAGSAMFSFVSLAAAFAHLPLVAAIAESLSRAIVAPFWAVLLAIYYFDVRIRHEGFDLETSLERLTAPQPA